METTQLIGINKILQNIGKFSSNFAVRERQIPFGVKRIGFDEENFGNEEKIG